MNARLRFSGTRARLALLVLLATVPALAITAYHGGQLRKQVRTAALADALRLAHLAAAYQSGSDPALLSQTAARTELPPGATLTLLDGEGTVVARYPDSEGWTGGRLPDPELVQAIASSGQVALETRAADGVARLTGIVPLAEVPAPAPAGDDRRQELWVAASILSSSAYSPVRQDLALRLESVGLIFLVALGVVWFGGGTLLVRPIKRLVEATRRVAGGDLGARAGVTGGPAEVRELASSFDWMATELQARAREQERVEGELRQRAAELGALQATVLEVASPHELHAVLAAIVERASSLLRVPRCGLYLCDSQRRECRMEVSHNLAQIYTGTVLKYGEGVAGRVAETGMPMILDDHRAWPNRAAAFHGDETITSVLSVPMVSQGEVIGVLNVGSRPPEQPFTSADQELLSLFASHAAIALQSARLHSAALQELDERRQSEQALRESEGRYRTLFAAAQRQAQELALLDQVRTALARELDPAVIYRTVVEAVASAFGYTQVSLYLLQDNALHLQHQVGYKQVLERIPLQMGVTGRVARTGEPALAENVRDDPDFLGAIDGIVSEVCVPLHDGAGVSGVLNVESTGDVALTAADLRLMTALSEHIEVAIARARLYAEARESEERYRRLFEDSPISLMEEDYSNVRRDLNRLRAFGVGDLRAYLDQHPGAVQELLAKVKMVDVNEATVRLYQAQSKDKLVTSLANIVAPAGLAAAKEHLIHIAAGNTRWRGEVANRTVTGEQRLLDITWQLFPGCEESWSRAVVSAIDITEEGRAIEESGRLESQLLQAQKMEALGLLAGGAAHDFNNLLSVILGNIELALGEAGEGTPLHKELSLIEKTTRRAAELTQQLLSFSRRRALQPHLLDANALVGEFSTLLRRVLGAHIEFSLDLAPQLAHVLADPGALEQVLMNLTMNAQDAMPNGGKLTISTAVVPVGAGAVKAQGAPAGDYVRLSVADTGVGMDEATRAHLFEPFFTTKERGKGTGLGLAVAYGIVAQHNGWIEVSSQVGSGTRFDVYIPAHAVPAAAPSKAKASPVVGGKETILLAEDEELVRELAQRILESLGYTVLPAADGGDAVRLFGEQSERIQLVILDAIMPHLTGPQAYEAIKRVRDVPVLFMTGYSAEMVGLPAAEMAGVRVLRKPFASQDLGRIVGEMLEARTAR